MAKKQNPDAKSDPVPDTPPAEPTSADNPAADPALAGASTHTGAKQIAAEQNGHEAPAAPAPDLGATPTPGYADYTMPDDYAGEDFITKARAWVEAHPGLAVLGAVGLGLAVGRLVAAAVPEPEPATLGDKLRTRAGELSKDAEKYAKVARKQAKAYSKEAKVIAHDASESAQEQLARAAEALGEAQSSIAHAAHEGYDKTKDLGDVVADAVKAAVAGVVVKKADSLIDKIRG